MRFNRCFSNSRLIALACSSRLPRPARRRRRQVRPAVRPDVQGPGVTGCSIFLWRWLPRHSGPAPRSTRGGTARVSVRPYLQLTRSGLYVGSVPGMITNSIFRFFFVASSNKLETSVKALALSFGSTRTVRTPLRPQFGNTLKIARGFQHPCRKTLAQLLGGSTDKSINSGL